MADGNPQFKGRPDDKKSSHKSDLIDDDISFDNRDMHKTWPMVKGCGMLILGLGAFTALAFYVFSRFREWF